MKILDSKFVRGFIKMANDGWFICTKCGNEVKVLVPDYVKVLSDPCPICGGKRVKK